MDIHIYFKKTINNVLNEETLSPVSQFSSKSRMKPKSNKVGFRIPINEFWIHELVANFYYGRDLLPRRTVSALAKMLLDREATDYMNREESVRQKLKGMVPMKYYNRLVGELDKIKAEQSALRKAYKRREEEIKNLSDHIKDQNRTIQILSSDLKQAQEKLRQSGNITDIESEQIKHT